MRKPYPLFAVALVTALLGLCGSVRGADGFGKLSGTVLDADGTPQMGASIWLNAEPVGAAVAQLLTNQNGVFSSTHLRPGLYSARVTLMGFLPSVEQHIRVQADLTTVIHIEMQSVLASFDQLRRQPAQPTQSDDWKWVLRSASATRPILQWRDGTVSSSTAEADALEENQPHMRVEMTTGGGPAGSVRIYPNTPATEISYDQPLGVAGRMLLAGQMSFGGPADKEMTLATVWLPSGQMGSGPETTVVMRQAPIVPGGPSVRQLRAEHTEQTRLGDGLVVEYGAEYLMSGVEQMRAALRPHGRVIVRISPQWMAAFSVDTEPGSYALRSHESSLDSAADTLDSLPQRVWQANGKSSIAGGWHEELAVRRDVGSRASVTVAAFHDFSDHQGVLGLDSTSGCEAPSPACSTMVYEHDAGEGSSWGTRVVYRQKLSDNLELAAIYAYAGALAMEAGANPNLPLPSQLQTIYVQSIAARISSRIPKMGTQLTASYKWVGAPIVSRQDIFGEAAMGLDPNLSLSVHQPLPMPGCAGRFEAIAEVRNVLSQGYASVPSHGGDTLLVPVMRSFRGGLSFKF
jgi:hypothetical protein